MSDTVMGELRYRIILEDYEATKQKLQELASTGGGGRGSSSSSSSGYSAPVSSGVFLGSSGGGFGTGRGGWGVAGSTRTSSGSMPRLSDHALDNFSDYLSPSAGGSGGNSFGRYLSRRFVAVMALRAGEEAIHAGEALRLGGLQRDLAPNRFASATAQAAAYRSATSGMFASYVGLGADLIGAGPAAVQRAALLGEASHAASMESVTSRASASVAGYNASLQPGDPVQAAKARVNEAEQSLKTFQDTHRAERESAYTLSRTDTSKGFGDSWADVQERRAKARIGADRLKSLDDQEAALQSGVTGANKSLAYDQRQYIATVTAKTEALTIGAEAARGLTKDELKNAISGNKVKEMIASDLSQEREFYSKNTYDQVVETGGKKGSRRNPYYERTETRWREGTQAEYEAMRTKHRADEVTAGVERYGTIAQQFLQRTIQSGNAAAAGIAFQGGIEAQNRITQGITDASKLLGQNKPYDAQLAQIKAEQDAAVAVANAKIKGGQAKGIFGIPDEIAGDTERKQAEAVGTAKTLEVQRAHDHLVRTLDIEQTGRKRQLQSLESRDPFGAQIVGRTTAVLEEMENLKHQGFKAQALIAGAAAQKELKLDRRDYLEAFRGKQFDLRNIGTDNPRDSQDPSVTLKNISDNLDILTKAIQALT